MTRSKRTRSARQGMWDLWIGLVALWGVVITGCAVQPKAGPAAADLKNTDRPGTIIATESMSPLSFDALVEELRQVPLVFVGEHHRNPDHHRIQLQILRAFYLKDPKLQVGMEMFDRSYQPVLDQWSSGLLDRETFLRRVHWYANWKFDFKLYQEILEFIQSRRIRLIGLNIPFHIPPKIAVGGIHNLSESERTYLPKNIELSNPAHRTYVRQVFQKHHVRGRDNFEFFYQAQCVWEDIMAETIAQNWGQNRMLVLAGNGHIAYRFGVPERAARRVGAGFRTIFLTPAGRPFEKSIADYVWITAPLKMHRKKTPAPPPMGKPCRMPGPNHDDGCATSRTPENPPGLSAPGVSAEMTGHAAFFKADGLTTFRACAA